MHLSNPRQTRGEAKRNEILDAAAAGFRDEGYEAISMDRIAELAGASKRTVYNHFGSKEALFHEVIARHLARSHAQIDLGYDAERGLEDQLHQFGTIKAELAADPEWIGMFRMVFGVMLHDPDIAREVSARVAAGEDSLVRWIRAADQDERLRAPDAERAATQFWALIKADLFWPQAVGFGGAPDRATREVVVREAVATFLARYRHPATEQRG